MNISLFETIGKEEVIHVLRISSSIRQALSHFGMRDNPHSYRKLKQYCLDNNIDYAAFAARKERHIVSLVEILKEGTDIKHHKDRLIKEGYLEGKCYGEDCTITNIWLKKPIKLHLDHINGIHDDNRIENLRFFCPNCHSQTDTYCVSKKAKRINYCSCGKEISLRSKECRECYYESKSFDSKKKIIWETTSKIIQQVELMGYAKYGRAIGVSDNAIRKHLSRQGLAELPKRVLLPSNTHLGSIPSRGTYDEEMLFISHELIISRAILLGYAIIVCNLPS